MAGRNTNGAKRGTTIAGVLAFCVLAPAVAGAVVVPIETEQPPDAWITASARMGLAKSQGIDATAIGTDAIDGVVLVHGLVGSEAERVRALTVVRRVPGVSRIRDALRVVPPADRETLALADALVAGRVEQALSFDPQLFEERIAVHAVSDGVAVIAGDVSEPGLHRRALELAAATDGVRRVVSLVRSPDPADDLALWEETVPGDDVEDPSRLARTFSDTWIETRLAWRFWTTPGVSLRDVEIDARDGIVTLFGAVESEDAKRKALARALDVTGVLLVDDALQVVPPSIAATVEEVDESLERAIETRLEQEQRLAGSDIRVEVRNATARLEGSVPEFRDRMTAILLAASTQGVRAVSDGLEVAEEPRG